MGAEFGLTPDQDFNTAFSGAHDNSIIGVAHKDYDAAAIANSVLTRMLDREGIYFMQVFRVLPASEGKSKSNVQSKSP